MSAVSSPDRSVWDRNFAEYRMREALYRADAEFGDMKVAIRVHDEVIMLLERDFGSVAKARLDPTGDSVREVAWQALTAAEERSAIHFDTPLDVAAINLALTPAPDLDAAIFKIQLIQDRQLDNLVSMPRDCMQIVLEDMARVAA